MGPRGQRGDLPVRSLLLHGSLPEALRRSPLLSIDTADPFIDSLSLRNRKCTIIRAFCLSQHA